MHLCVCLFLVPTCPFLSLLSTFVHFIYFRGLLFIKKGHSGKKFYFLMHNKMYYKHKNRNLEIFAQQKLLIFKFVRQKIPTFSKFAPKNVDF